MGSDYPAQGGGDGGDGGDGMSVRTRAARDNCATPAGLFSLGVSPVRQLPAPTASAWLFDLGDIRGPWLVVLRDHEDEARERLAEHLVDLGLATDMRAAFQILEDVRADNAGVVW